MLSAAGPDGSAAVSIQRVGIRVISAEAALQSRQVFFDGSVSMFYVQRDRQGALIRVEAAPYAEATETLPADHHEIQAWYANDVVETSLKQLKQSDLDMIRVLDDLIQVLTSKGIIRVTDLPAAAQAKLKDRSSARVALGGLNQLINDDETGLI